jgi:hypothetical protein
MQTAHSHGGATTMMISGSLACIGLGVLFDAHLTPATRRRIARSDVIFAADPHAAAFLALNDLHNDIRSLWSEASAVSNSLLTDDAIVELVLEEIRHGKQVCVAFLGHPSCGTSSAHMLIRAAHQEGFHATFEPAISIENCIYADLGIDPGKFGCQQYDVSQIMLYRRSIDTSAYLLLWRFGAEDMRPEPRRKLLVEVLAREYPLDHQVFAYVPPTIDAPAGFTTWAIGSLVKIDARPLTAIIIPPAADLLPDKEIRARLGQLSASAGFSS